jgi:hypothetical protein
MASWKEGALGLGVGDDVELLLDDVLAVSIAAAVVLILRE